MELDIHSVLEWNFLVTIKVIFSKLSDKKLESTSTRKNPKVVDKATFPEQESWDLAIEVTCHDPVLTPLPNGSFAIKWQINLEYLLPFQ